jgi:hypothetical protein
MKADIASVLDNCIDDLRKGGTPQRCLDNHPDAAPELAPLLKAAAFIQAAPKATASEATMRAGKIDFLQEAARLRSAQKQKPADPRQRLSLVASRSFILPRLRPIAWAPAAGFMLALSLILGSATTAIAATRSLPDNVLYPVKLVTEQAQLAVTTNPISRADLALSHAERRVDELSTLNTLGRPVDAPTIERLASASQQALATISQIDDDAMQPRLRRYLAIVTEEQDVLRQIVPSPAAVDAVATAAAAARQNGQRAEDAIKDPAVIEEPPINTGRGQLAEPKETPTPVPTPDGRRMRTPQPTATATVAPPEPSATVTSTPPPTATAVPPTVTVSATVPLPTALPQVSFSGVIQKVSASEWVIDGRTVRVDGQTKISGPAPQAGARADVVAVAPPNQSLLAISIAVIPADAQAPSVALSGVVLAINAQGVNVGGQAIQIVAGTAINGNPVVGSIVDVSAWNKTPDILVAASITVKGSAPEAQVQGRIERLSPAAWTVAGQVVEIVAGLTSINGQAAVGNSASVSALRVGDRLLARDITVRASVVEEEFEGIINRAGGDGWTINGRRVVRNGATQVDESRGPALAGARVRVRGVGQTDGSILATSVSVLAAAIAGQQPSPTVVPPSTVVPPGVVPPPTVVPPVSPTQPPAPTKAPPPPQPTQVPIGKGVSPAPPPPDQR